MVARGEEADMQYKALDPEIEVNGQTVLSVVKGAGSAGWLVEKMLADQGIVDPQPGEWYSQQAWLDAFRTISDKVGVLTLHKIGASIPESADWPPDVTGIHEAMASIDIAYHLNHRRHGVALIELATRTMHEGIGHYTYSRAGETEGLMECDDPYPCDFDRGIIEATAGTFKPPEATVRVLHGSGCRKQGAPSCVYHIMW
jgi:hypothetical protein